MGVWKGQGMMAEVTRDKRGGLFQDGSGVGMEVGVAEHRWERSKMVTPYATIKYVVPAITCRGRICQFAEQMN
jgi:hypothetical protein